LGSNDRIINVQNRLEPGMKFFAQTEQLCGRFESKFFKN
jgi:hypothetical protein